MNSELTVKVSGETIILESKGIPLLEFNSKEEIIDLVLQLNLASDCLFGRPSFYEHTPTM